MKLSLRQLQFMTRHILITRRERFCAAHRLSRPDWTDEQNTEVFGKCANPNWHGHNYELYVTVKGPVNPETGFVLDLKMLSEMINKLVISHVDHKNINIDTPFMRGKLASTENLCLAIWDQLNGPISEKGAKLHGIKLLETENNWVEYHGE
jgi:6-pyruvoyltetrahydropterin/6-carboxytetrahydropterin synthase